MSGFKKDKIIGGQRAVEIDGETWLDEIPMCGSCGVNKASECNHYCPYQDQIQNNHDEAYCNCCDDCMDSCGSHV